MIDEQLLSARRPLFPSRRPPSAFKRPASTSISGLPPTRTHTRTRTEYTRHNCRRTVRPQASARCSVRSSVRLRRGPTWSPSASSSRACSRTRSARYVSRCTTTGLLSLHNIYSTCKFRAEYSTARTLASPDEVSSSCNRHYRYLSCPLVIYLYFVSLPKFHLPNKLVIFLCWRSVSCFIL